MASKIQIGGYAGVLAICFAAGMAGGWARFANRIDNYAYDLMSPELGANGTLDSVVVAIDEPTLVARHGMQNIRGVLVEALDQLAEAKPKVVALDVILADEGDPTVDARLENSLRATPNLILPSELSGSNWEDPALRFKNLAAALGHIQSESEDGVSRRIALEQTAAGERRWALSLEAFRVARGAVIVESPEDVEVGNTVIPAPRKSGRLMRIRYLAPGTIPTISALEIRQHRDQLRGKTVFLGITALSAAKDRLLNSLGDNVAGVEVHAQAYETMERGRFVTDASDLTVLLVCAGFAVAAGLIFGFQSGWPAYGVGLILIAAAHFTPVLFFRHDVVFPYVAPMLVAWLTSAGAATYQHFVVRRRLHRSESEKSRYQQAIHWAAHEMRTPLTSIQGSSEIMSRYKLPEEKRTQLNEMINSESKRLARIIQTFLDVERLNDGQVEMKRETFAAADLVDVCMKRVTPLGARKRIALTLDSTVDGILIGDRELMEYALYNLLTNAVKYSPEGTHVRVFSELRGSELRLAVQDEGIGIDSKEIKSIFRKFYRTKRAEASGEVGTGIGLSIVEQIIANHEGRIEVASTPGKGSCFTIVMTARSVAPNNAETADRRR